MEQVGAKLRDARVARGMSVEDVAQVTKIPRASVAALEADDLRSLPALIFVKGFVRAYARAVDLEPGPLVRGLDELVRTREIEREAQVGPRRPSARRRTTSEAQVLPLAAAAATSRRVSGSGLKSGYVLLVVVAAGLLLAAWLMVGGKRSGAPTVSGTAGPSTPAIQERVDGVSSITDDEAPRERLR